MVDGGVDELADWAFSGAQLCPDHLVEHGAISQSQASQAVVDRPAIARSASLGAGLTGFIGCILI